MLRSAGGNFPATLCIVGQARINKKGWKKIVHANDFLVGHTIKCSASYNPHAAEVEKLTFVFERVIDPDVKIEASKDEEEYEKEDEDEDDEDEVIDPDAEVEASEDEEEYEEEDEEEDDEDESLFKCMCVSEEFISVEGLIK
ncbi:hypothetical protein CJ030_MR8G004526 [Morella rubra]|uniref:Uncharacterized protein n=1 Tax=Morella rubra TaxID=262757 RepID=A0A6A1UP23_9ROSI|nr:hypothetical protein CJ030_MR8G004526 [Morella rubra]